MRRHGFDMCGERTKLLRDDRQLGRDDDDIGLARVALEPSRHLRPTVDGLAAPVRDGPADESGHEERQDDGTDNRARCPSGKARACSAVAPCRRGADRDEQERIDRQERLDGFEAESAEIADIADGKDDPRDRRYAGRPAV